MKSLLYISIGAFLGTLLRYMLTKVVIEDYALGSLLINSLGSFLYCFFGNIASKFLRMREFIEHMIMFGFVGSFTSFSSFMIICIEKINSQNIFTLFIYMISSITVGIIFGLLGIIFSNRLLRNKKLISSSHR